MIKAFLLVVTSIVHLFIVKTGGLTLYIFLVFTPLIDIHHPKRLKAWTLSPIIKP